MLVWVRRHRRWVLSDPVAVGRVDLSARLRLRSASAAPAQVLPVSTNHDPSIATRFDLPHFERPGQTIDSLQLPTLLEELALGIEEGERLREAKFQIRL